MPDFYRFEGLNILSQSLFYGNLEIFIDVGFSKVIINDEDKDCALLWGNLLRKYVKV